MSMPLMGAGPSAGGAAAAPPATTTYYPNSTNCVGWDGEDATRPPVAAYDVEAALSSGELDTITADDANSVMYAAPQGSRHYPFHRIRFKVAETPANITNITPTFKGYGVDAWSAVNGYNLYIWNDNTSLWEAVDSHTTSTKDTVTGSVTVSCANYVITGGYIDIVVVGPAETGDMVTARCWTYYGQLAVTA